MGLNFPGEILQLPGLLLLSLLHVEDINRKFNILKLAVLQEVLWINGK